MDREMEDVIRNIIHIDKSAQELREDVEKKLKERRDSVNREIEELHLSIINEKKTELLQREGEVMKETQDQVDGIRKSMEMECLRLQSIYADNKSALIENMFNEIVSNVY